MTDSKQRSRNPPAHSVPTRECFIEVALEMIEEKGGCRGVNLRQIAMKMNVTHASLYNYYKSLESLYWAALGRAVDRQIQYIHEHLDPQLPPEEKLRRFLQLQIEYAREHPGLYRLVWMEPIGGSTPDEELVKIDEIRQLWLKMISVGVHGKIAPQNMALTGQLVHGYFHGELCIMIGRDSFIIANPVAEIRIVENTFRLIKMSASFAEQANPQANHNQ